jgi:hypothetical protein
MIEKFLNVFRRDKILVAILITGSGVKTNMIVAPEQVDPFVLIQCRMIEEGLDQSIDDMKELMTVKTAKDLLKKIEREDIPALTAINEVLQTTNPGDMYR